MAMLADTVDGARRRRHPPPHPGRRGAHPGRWRARPDHHPRRCGRLPAAARLRPRPGAWPPRVGSGRRGQLRRRPGGVPAAARRTRRGGRPIQAAGSPQRCQERRPGRGPPPPARHLARSAWPGARRRGQREALRALLTTRRCAPPGPGWPPSGELKALIVDAPEELHGASTATQIQRCASLRARPARSPEHQVTVRALRTTAGARPVPGRRGRLLRDTLNGDDGDMFAGDGGRGDGDGGREGAHGPSMPWAPRVPP
jgi:hypothetical protein